MKHPLGPLLLVILAALVLQGCASAPLAAADSPPPLPPDFILGLTVLTPPGVTDPAPARHVMEADWVLRTALGAGVSPATFPLRTRQLSRDQVVSIWQMVHQSPLLSPDHPARIGSWPADRAPPLRPVYIVEFTVDGQHRVLAIDAESEDAGSAKALAERLGELAWVR